MTDTGSPLHFLPPLYQEAPDHGGLILRDGSTASIRTICPEDRELMRDFFSTLSPESRYRRFFTMALPALETLDEMATAHEPEKRFVLVVTRELEGRTLVIGTGSYHRLDDRTAEVAMAVDDRYQGLGLGSQLLERLAVIALQHGITRFTAVTQLQNQPMLQVFHHSGFPIHESMTQGYVDLDFPVMPGESSNSRAALRDRLFTAASLRPFFHPRSVAVIGPGRDRQSIGHRVLEQILKNGFEGPVFPVHPSAHHVCSIRAVRNVTEITEPVDLAIIAVPAIHVMEVTEQCARKGVKAVVVISAGFAETGPEGAALQHALTEKVRSLGMRMIGPNCLGVLNTDPQVSLNGSFSHVFPPAGRIAMSSQSGGLGLALLAMAREMGLGFSSFASIGNKGDVSGNDLLQYWEGDPATDVILLYMESFGNPRRFARIARRVSSVKPILCVKAGRFAAGKRAASSHTAALMSSDTQVDALFQQTGVLRTDTLEEMFELAAGLVKQPLPRGPRVAILTNAGGPGILCADACEQAGLVVPTLTDGTQAALRRFLPPAAGTLNPVDMVASATPENFLSSVRILMEDPGIDAVIAMHIPVIEHDGAAVFAAVARGAEEARSKGATEKPLLFCSMGATAGIESAGTPAIPVYHTPEAPAHVLGRMLEYRRWREKPGGIVPELPGVDIQKAVQIVEKSLDGPDDEWLGPERIRQLLECFSIGVMPGEVARDADHAAAVSRAIGFPVVMKIVSKDILHKSDVGGVELDLADEDSVRTAFARLEERVTAQGKTMDGVWVQPMIEGATEIMVGIENDPQFGPIVTVGLGGIHVEILRDVAFRLCPLTDTDAGEMIRGLRGYRLLEGYRGHPPADVPALEDLLLRLSRMAEEVPRIRELDLNPIMVLPPGKGLVLVDARLRLAGRVP